MQATDGIASLVALGFTDLEARVYAHLVAEGDSTGYRIAQVIGKPVANTYKAIESLERKGAALVEDGPTRVVRAVDPARVLDALGKRHATDLKRAQSILKRAERNEEDARVYTVTSEAQALERARQMLAEAISIVLVRTSAETRAALAEEIADAEGRGVDVAQIDGTGLAVALDAAQALVAPEGVWTRNPAVARLVFEGLAAEATLAELGAHLDDGAGPKKLQRALAARRRVPEGG